MRDRSFLAAAILALILIANLLADDLVNLAPKAKVSASSEYNENHLAKWAVDGKIPELQCKADEKQAWCVRGSEGKHGEFTLTWPQPVEVAEVVYFGRTGQIIQECFKDYEVYLDAAAEPCCCVRR